jgi:tetratricopeptide (TPR) repeat protein
VCSEYDLAPKTLTDGARAALRTYEWPGNVRQLANVIERAVLLSDADTIDVSELDLPAGAPNESRAAPPPATLEDTYRDRLVDALERTAWNITRTAALLGVTRNTVRARMRLYGLRSAGRAAEPATSAPAPAAADVTLPAMDRAEPTAPADMRWERRRVTFLRARVLAAVDTPSSVTTRVLGWLIEKARTFGGHVSEISQHGIVVIFGHEPAEDAPRRAATAALAVTKLVGRALLHGDLPSDVSVALAIHVDRVALARIAGRPVIERDAAQGTAAPLDALEPIGAGEIGVSDAAVRFLTRHFDVKPVPGARARGHRLVGRWGTPGGAHPVTFIGRRPEIDLLHGLLDRAMLGHGQIVTLVGDPGIGKSRLLHEFQQSAQMEGVSVYVGHCASYATHVPYTPAIDILQAVCNIEDTDPIETVDAKVLAALQPLGDAAVASAPYLQYLLFPRTGGTLGDRSPDAIKIGTFEAVRRVVLAQQDRRTLLLAVEDLHWIDQTSAELLASLADLTSAARVLLVTTCRPGHDFPWRSRSNATQIALGPISAPESRQLVEAVLATRPVADAVVARILDRAEGNPFVLEELARSVREQADETAALAVPGTVEDIIATRLDGLAAADRYVLDVAAVIGRDVPVSILQEASNVAADRLHDTLARLQSGEFLYRARVGADAQYTFRHVLIHDVAYDGVAADTRAQLHECVAAAIEKLAPETGERRPETLARHYTAAGRRSEAIEYWYRTGQLAMRRSAHRDAIAHLTEALRLLDREPAGHARNAQELKIQLALAASLTAAHGYAATEVEAALARIQRLSDELDDPVRQFAVRFGLWRFHLSRADFHPAEILAAQLLASAQTRDDPVLLVTASLASGVDKFYLGELGAAREHLERATRAYDPSQSPSYVTEYGQDLGAAAWGFLGWARGLAGDLRDAEAHAQRALELARAIGHPFSLALALLLACEVHEVRREPARVRVLGDELVRLARDHALTFFSAIGLMHAGWARAAGDEPEVGLAMMEDGDRLFRAAGQRVGFAFWARLAEVLIAAGRIDGARRVIADASLLMGGAPRGAFAAEHLRLEGEALARRGDAGQGRTRLRAALDLARRQGAWLFALRAAMALAWLDPAARDDLAKVVDRFPPELESEDLRRARTMLLSAP